MKMKKQLAFTLAEVLVTLGIIGVVSALSLPTLVNDHKKKTAAVKLEKFYSVMSQALTSYYADKMILPGEEQVPSGDDFGPWFRNGIGSYMKLSSVVNSSNEVKAALPDGSGFYIKRTGNGTFDIIFCTEYTSCNSSSVYNGRSSFYLNIENGSLETTGDDNRSTLISSCKSGESSNVNKRPACTKLIQMDGWKIKEDYPWN